VVVIELLAKGPPETPILQIVASLYYLLPYLHGLGLEHILIGSL
jgi:hypothetical protein